jgi:chromosome segregation ATPase
MARPSDARQYTREVYPHILKEGRSPSVTEVKAAVRLMHPELPATWNPSNITVATELAAINREFGERLLSGASVTESDLPEALVRGLNFAGADLWEIAKKEAAKAFDGERAVLAGLVAEANAAHEMRLAEIETLKQRHAEEQSTQAQEHAALRASFEVLRGQANQLQEALQSATLQHANTMSLLEETEKALTQTAGELSALTTKARNDLALAAERYDGLVKTSTAQIDGVRQSRNDALKEAKEWKVAAERREAELAKSNVALRDMAAKVGEANGQVRLLTKQVERRAEAADALERRHTQLATKLAAVRDALKRLSATKVTTKTTVGSILEKVDAIVVGM